MNAAIEAAAKQAEPAPGEGKTNLDRIPIDRNRSRAQKKALGRAEG